MGDKVPMSETAVTIKVPQNDQPQVILTVNPPSSLIRADFCSRTANALGIFQILVSFVTIGAAFLLNIWEDDFGVIGYGYWGAAAAVFTGILALAAAATRHRAVIWAYLGMSFISMGIVGYMAYYALLGLILDEETYTNCIMNKPGIVNSGVVITAIMLELSFVWSISIAGECCVSCRGAATSRGQDTTVIRTDHSTSALDMPLPPPPYAECIDGQALPTKQMDLESPPPYVENLQNEEATKVGDGNTISTA